jgi:hypothetical protein
MTTAIPDAQSGRHGKAPEIAPGGILRPLEIEPLAIIPFDAPLFGEAANSGLMIAESAAKSPVAESLSQIAHVLLRHQEPGLFGADRYHRPDAAGQARRRKRARGNPRYRQRDHRAQERIAMSIAEQEELLDDICNDVLGYGPLEPLLARDDIADIMVNGADPIYIEVDGKMSETDIRFRDNSQLAEHLPAHRQPGRPPRRRIEPDLRRAPARRLSCQRDRAAAGDRRRRADHP